jgi:hypothetical protein
MDHDADAGYKKEVEVAEALKEKEVSSAGDEQRIIKLKAAGFYTQKRTSEVEALELELETLKHRLEKVKGEQRKGAKLYEEIASTMPPMMVVDGITHTSFVFDSNCSLEQFWQQVLDDNNIAK